MVISSTGCPEGFVICVPADILAVVFPSSERAAISCSSTPELLVTPFPKPISRFSLLVGAGVDVRMSVDVRFGVGVAVIVLVGVEVGAGVGVVVAVLIGVGVGAGVGVVIAVLVGVGVGAGVGVVIAVLVGVGLTIIPEAPTVTLPLVRLIDTAEPFGSPTTTFDILSKDIPYTVLEVKLILTNVPGFETLQPGVVMAPTTPMIVPAILFIVPETKYVPQPPWLSRFPSVTLLA
jgi:hypothetical protein